MFFQGTLQEGIAMAVQQSRSVVCFVTDSGTESQQWEEDFLAESNTGSLIETQAVLLRLEAGSQEEGFLTQLYPIPKKPTLIVIKNGELKEYIAAGTSRDEFARRVQSVLQPITTPPTAVTNQQAQAPASATATSPGPQAVARMEDPSADSSPGQATPPSSSESQAAQSILVEQAARLAAQRKRDEELARQRHAREEKAKEAAKQRQIEEQKAKEAVRQRNAKEEIAKDAAAAATAAGPADPSSKDAQTKKHSDMIKKRQKEAREERQRILKTIQDDKAERQARQAELEAERQAVATAAAATSTTSGRDVKGKGIETTPLAPATKPQPRSSNGRLAEQCAIQVRLLDGSTIRNRFSSATDTIKEVRKWVDEARTDGRTPYTFKILLTPLPSKAIDAAEESQSLRALKLAPSATLIIAPAAGKKYTPAYSASTPVPTVTNSEPLPEGQDQERGDNILIRFIAFLMGIITGVVEVITGFFSTLFSVSGPPQPVNQDEQRSSSSTTTGRDTSSGASRIKGLGRPSQAERNNDNDQQFYNGNSTNFQPRPDDKNE